MTPELIASRHQMLSSWFREVLRHPEVGHCDLIEPFLCEIKTTENREDLVLGSDGQAYVKLDLGKMGYLHKLQNGRFKPFWAVLRDNVLYKYRSHSDKHPYGQMVCVECDVVEVEYPDGELDYVCFMVLTDKERFIFGTETIEETEDWVDCLAAATFPLTEEE